MKKVTIGILIGFLLALMVPAGFLLGRSWWAAFTEVPGSSPSGTLVCSNENYMAYMAQVAQAGEMGLGKDPAGRNPEDFARMVQAFERIGVDGQKTTIVAAHVPTGQTYVEICAQERCTMEEMAAPNTACLTDHMNGCSDIAIRFRNTNYCLLEPPKVDQ